MHKKPSTLRHLLCGALADSGRGSCSVVPYAERGITETLIGQLATEPDRIFPYFIATELPVGISGLFIAAIFAAAISTLDSGLAEASDLTVNHLYAPVRSGPLNLTTSLCRACLWPLGRRVFLSCAVLCKVLGSRLLQLTFKLPNYIYGAIFATILLALSWYWLLGLILWGSLLACVVVALLSLQGVAFFYWCPMSGAAMFLFVWAMDRRPFEWSGIAARKIS